MQQDPTETASGRPLRRRSLWSRLVSILALSCFALVVFAGTAAVQAPASIIARFVEPPPQLRSLSGTLWSGQAALKGGLTLFWDGDWRGLLRGRLQAGLRVTGPQTLLEGTGFAGLGQAGLQNVTGRGGPEMLDLAPGAVPCTGSAVVDIDDASVSRRAVIANGRVRISESICQPPGGAALATPALNLDLMTEGVEGVAVLTTDDADRDIMGTVRLGPDGWAKLRIEPAGARLVPGLPASAPTILEFQMN